MPLLTSTRQRPALQKRRGLILISMSISTWNASHKAPPINPFIHCPSGCKISGLNWKCSYTRLQTVYLMVLSVTNLRSVLCILTEMNHFQVTTCSCEGQEKGLNDWVQIWRFLLIGRFHWLEWRRGKQDSERRSCAVPVSRLKILMPQDWLTPSIGLRHPSFNHCRI